MLLISASNTNESIVDVTKILKLQMRPGNIFWCSSAHHIKTNIAIYTHFHVANKKLEKRIKKVLINNANKFMICTNNKSRIKK